MIKNDEHKINSRVHAKKRFKERFGLDINKEKYYSFCDYVKYYKSELFPSLISQNNGDKIIFAPLQNRYILFVYHKSSNTIKTVYEPPKEYNTIIFLKKTSLYWRIFKSFKFKSLLKLIQYKIPQIKRFQYKNSFFNEIDFLDDSDQNISPLFIYYLDYLDKVNYPLLDEEKKKWDRFSKEKKYHSIEVYKLIKDLITWKI